MLNHIVLMGRLTDNPDLRSVGSGISTVSFTLAVNRDFKNKDTGEFETDFIDIQAWRHTAEFVSKYFTKGQLVAVEGRLQIESYTDREGVRRRAARVVASQCHFAEGKRDGQQTTNYAQGFNPPPRQEASQPASTYTPPAGGGQFATPSTAGGQFATPSTAGGQFATPPAGGEQFATPPAGGGQFATPPAGGGQFATPPAGGGQFATPDNNNNSNGTQFREIHDSESELPF